MTGHRSPDAVIVGGGPNGLVAANLLTDAGWDVLLLEQQPQVGGAVVSAQDVAPGFEHDTFSSFYPLGVASPVISALELQKWGLVWSHAPAVIGTPTADGRWALVHRDVERTAAGLEELCPGDGDGWLRLYDLWQQLRPGLVQSLLTPFPPVRGGLRLAAALPKAGGTEAVRLLLESARSVSGRFLSGEAARLLIVGNAAHADISPDSAGSGVFGLLLALIGQADGFPVPRGGAGRFSDALAARFVAGGGRIRCCSRVRSVRVADGRAVGVELDDGETVEARRAVIADVPAPTLYGAMLDPHALPARFRRRMLGFEWDPGTVKVDWALSGGVPWAGVPDAAPGTVHLADSVTEVSTWMAKVTGRVVPADPFLLIGQMSTADPTRSPAGTEALWAYTHVPHGRVQDEAGQITGRWDASDLDYMADRMQARIARYAPGLADRIIVRRVLGPHELEERNANLVGGALGGGTAALHQEVVFRPVAGRGRAETPVPGLYLGSSSAHPGAGVHGAPGANAARAALWHAHFSTLSPRSWWRRAREAVPGAGRRSPFRADVGG